MKLLFFLLLTSSVIHAGPSQWVVSETHELAKVVAEFPVGYSLLTTPERQYVAYYGVDRQMTVASRRLDSNEWIYQTLPSKVVWDSHNYVTLAIDRAGHLHVSGNMHVVPLIYFRTQKPGDIRSLRAAPMVGKLEDRVTYPSFLKSPQGQLIFTYRQGSSGNGLNFYNQYDEQTQSWSRLFKTPLFDGEGLRNAYAAKIERGADGFYHAHWVWRDSPDCATNQHLSYARSRDLIQWESAFGERIELPIRFGQKQLVVDPIPPGGGIINGGHRLGFDAAHQPLLVYHKSDAKGNMQIHAARPQDGAWKIVALTDWRHPVVFSGNGSMGGIGIGLGALDRVGPNAFTISTSHRNYGSGLLSFDAKKLKPLEKSIPSPDAIPQALEQIESQFAGVGIKRANDLGSCGTPGVRYLLQWETLGANRDKPRTPPLPKPSTLRLYKLTQGGE